MPACLATLRVAYHTCVSCPGASSCEHWDEGVKEQFTLRARRRLYRAALGHSHDAPPVIHGRRGTPWRRWHSCPARRRATCGHPAHTSSQDVGWPAPTTHWTTCAATNSASWLQPSQTWLDASALGANQMAAPALAIQFPTCVACFSTDWDGAPMAPLMASVELVSVFTLARMGAGADAESLGILAKVYCTYRLYTSPRRDRVARPRAGAFFWHDRRAAHATPELFFLGRRPSALRRLRYWPVPYLPALFRLCCGRLSRLRAVLRTHRKSTLFPPLSTLALLLPSFIHGSEGDAGGGDESWCSDSSLTFCSEARPLVPWAAL